MAKITLYNERPADVTCVPDRFIDEYMTHANGEYVKIYLYLLRCMNRVECRFSLSQIADHFDCTEKDVLRALRYWEKLQLFRLEYDAHRNLSGICILTDSHTAAPAKDTAPRPAGSPDVTNSFIRAVSPARPSYSMDELQKFCEEDSVRELIFITEQYLGRTLNQSDLNFIFFWHDELGFPTELIEFLIENCVAKGHTSLHYMQKIAEEFAAKNVRTVSGAKELLNQNTAAYHAVMKAFGIRGRNLVPAETEFLQRWQQGLGFSIEMISEACSRTMNAIHEASFVYANSILEKWHQNQIHTLEDVKKADMLYQQTQKARYTKPAASASNTNRFANFKQRDNNYEDLQKQLIISSLQ